MAVDWDAQIQILLDIGYDLRDAESTIARVRSMADEDDPNWMPSVEQLDSVPMSVAAADAALHWDAPSEFQRILDARDDNSDG